MDLRAYLVAIRRGWLLIIATTLLGAAAGAAAYLLTPPTYASTVDFYVSTPNTAGNNPQSSAQFAQNRVNSYVQLLSSEQLATQVIASTGLDMSARDVSSRIQGATQLNTVIVTATILDDSPSHSLQIAQGVADAFPKLVNRLDNAGQKKPIVAINVISGPNLKPGTVGLNRTVQVALGTIVGLVLGVLISVLRVVLDNTIRTTDVARSVVGKPVVGAIPLDSQISRSPLTVGAQSGSLRAEAFRRLRTNLSFIHAAKAADTIVITSAVPQEGKTLIAVNLAIAFAESGEKTLVIDANLRSPMLGGLLAIETKAGLSNVLAGQVDAKTAIGPSGVDALSVLTAGAVPPNPAELLGSQQMAALLSDLGEEFDKIILDSPPLLPVTDAAVVATAADAVVLVVRQGKTTRGQVARAASTLEQVDATLVGSVLNVCKTTRHERRRYGMSIAGREDQVDQISDSVAAPSSAAFS